MTTIKIKQNQTAQYNVGADDTTYILENGVSIASPDHGFFVGTDFSYAVLRIDGAIQGVGQGSTGIYSEGHGTQIEMGKSGSIDSVYGIYTEGDGSTLINRGKIISNTVSIEMDGDGSRIVNHGDVLSHNAYAVYSSHLASTSLISDGRLISAMGIKLDADNLTVKFGADSVVKADSYVMYLTSGDGDTSRVVNHGEIRATQKDAFLEAIEFGDGADTLRNSGDIWGNIYLGDGADLYDGRGGGVHKGNVLGEEGDDTYKIDGSKTYVFEGIGEGYDKLFVGSSYALEASSEMEEVHLSGKADIDLTGNLMSNQLFGNAGDNRIDGGSGSDVLLGGKGRDVLIGGAGTDYFQFKSNAGVEIVADFVNGTDHLFFGLGNEIKDVADLLAHHVKQVGDDVVIAGDGTRMIIRNLDIDNLGTDDFGI